MKFINGHSELGIVFKISPQFQSYLCVHVLFYSSNINDFLFEAGSLYY